MTRHMLLPRDIENGNGPARSGIDVAWTKTAQRLDFGGWYDSFVGITGDSMTLREFFDELGITEKDCAKAWKHLTKR